MNSEIKDQLLEQVHQLRSQLPFRIEDQAQSHVAEDSLHRTIDELEAIIEKANTDLCESTERFSHAMRGANDGLWDWNLETDEVYYSPRWKSMLGYEESELEGSLDTWKALVHPDDKDSVLEQIEDYLEGRSDSFEAEMRMIHKDGHEVVVLSRAFLVRNEARNEANEKPARMVGTHVDITERTRSEEFILATSDILKMIATREPASDIYDAIALLYESRHPGMRCSMLILVGNKLMHGGAPSLPEEYCDAVNGLENGPTVGSCGTATYHGKQVLVEDIETDPKWAKIKHVALPHGMRCCWSEPIKNSRGEVLGAFGMYYDHPALPNESEANDLASAARLAGIIMEREKSEHELNKYRHHLEELVEQRTLELEAAKREAEEANKAKSNFLSSMSHELRTPLNAIIGFGQVLISDPSKLLSNDQEEGLGHILKSGEHLLELINEILDLSQIEAGKVSLTIEPVNLREVVNEAVELVQTLADKHDVRVVNSVSSHLSPDLGVIADHLRLKQVLLNLLSNGIKYNKPGGTVSIRVVSDETQHRVVIQDTGRGIDKKDIATLFEPFNRLGAEATTIEGTGIGLTITKRLVEVMDGSLSLASTPGKGSAFTVALDAGELVKSSQSRNKVLPDESPASIGGGQKTILYVEDNNVNVRLVQTILRRRPDIRLVVAETGGAGIDLAEQELPSLILMDMQLPDMNGLDALRAIQEKAVTANIPVVGVSADAMPEVIKATEKEGFCDYITKPFRIDHFLKVVNSCMCSDQLPRRANPSSETALQNHRSRIAEGPSEEIAVLSA